MLISEQIESAGNKRLEQQKAQGFGEKFTPTMAIHEHVDEKMADDIFAGLRNMYQVMFLYNTASDKPISVAVENMAQGFLESIKNWKGKKIMFSAPVYIKRGDGTIIDYLIGKLHHLTNNDANINEDDKRKLEPVWSEVYSLVSKGNYVSEKVSQLLPEDVLRERENYLSILKNIVCSSIEKGEEKDVTVERDNVFYSVKCPEKSVITPSKLLSSSEFQSLDGVLKIGEGSDVIRIQNGQYHDMKGRVKMTFKVGDEKIEMILSSEKAESFGKIMVHMDDKNYEIFLKHREELEKESRISKVVEAAKSFVQTKSSEVNPPSSVLQPENVSKVQPSQNNNQSVGQ